MLVERFSENPLLRPEDIEPSRDGFDVVGTFNAGAFRLGDRHGLIVRVAERPVSDDPALVPVPAFDTSSYPPAATFEMLRRDDPLWDFSTCVVSPVKNNPGHHCRLTNLSHFRIAWSEDGRRFSFGRLPGAVIWPDNELERFGIEDARVTQMGRTYLITYSAVSDRGICVGLISTTDFRLFARHGRVLPHENKDACLFPEKIDDEYVMLHRPSSGWCRPGMWIARSPDLVHWGRHEFVAAPRPDRWDSRRIGAGPPPIRTKNGWLEIYHGAGDDAYGLGAMLLDLGNPARVIARSGEPVMLPETDYEKNGFVENVVFCNGLIQENDAELRLYYGGADTVTAGTACNVKDVLDSLE